MNFSAISDDPQNLEKQYPCLLSIKVVGHATATFEEQVLQAVLTHATTVDPLSFKHNQSRTGKYRSLSFPFYAESRAHLQALYDTLSTCDQVVWAI